MMLKEDQLAQLVEDDYLTDPTWTTKDGRKIKVKDMSDKHLCNTLRMVYRRAEMRRWDAIEEGYKFMGMLRGEMAIDAAESAVARIEDNSTFDFMAADDVVDAMMQEAKRRKLNWLSKA